MKKSKNSDTKKVFERPLSENELTDKARITGKDRANDETAKLTEEDREALGLPDLSNDTGEDEPLRQRTHSVDFAGEDLDVPGAELDDEQEEIGAEDEENNIYSLGGDRHGD